MCILAIGPSLRKIDDSLVTNVERYQAQKLSPTAAQAIRLGYLLESPDLSPEELEIIYQNQLSLHIDKFRNTISTSPHMPPSPKPVRPSSPSLLSRPSCLNTHHVHTPKVYHKLIPPLKFPLATLTSPESP
eukprot:Phypoly_transcript_14065.p1 GENE.Phypoly_transcript_14065~~Phypoly_transcript_14065.p1  ORF type:complete len:131 (+),score=22.17 Phypoly_transcript_14065:489-881(+)